MTEMPAWISTAVKSLDEAAAEAAAQRQGQLTKPPGSLGRLETLAVRLAALQGWTRPVVEKLRIVVFAADHGVAAEGVSAFPQAVTVEMIRNFSRGGAAIAVLARELGAELEVVDVGAVQDPGPLPGVLSRRIAPGTGNFAQGAAMDAVQLGAALEEGRQAVTRAGTVDLFIGGEMGIANTTSAAAVAAAVLGQPPERLAGPGTGLDSAGVRHKTAVIQQALDLHAPAPGDARTALQCLGGFEIAALAGAYIACAQTGIPVLVDGFIATVAALAAVRLNAGVKDWLLFSHASAEPGHAQVCQALQAEPLLNLGMRLGEGSGAAVAVPLLRLACALHGGMATFAEAGISGG